LPNDTRQGKTDPPRTDSRVGETALDALAEKISREQEALALRRATDAKERRERERLADLERIRNEQGKEEEKLQQAAAEQQADAINGREQNVIHEGIAASEAKNIATNRSRDRHESKEQEQRRATETQEEKREHNRHEEQHDQRQHEGRGNGHAHTSRRVEHHDHHSHENDEHKKESQGVQMNKKKEATSENNTQQPAQDEPCAEQEAGTELVTQADVNVVVGSESSHVQQQACGGANNATVNDSEQVDVHSAAEISAETTDENASAGNLDSCVLEAAQTTAVGDRGLDGQAAAMNSQVEASSHVEPEPVPESTSDSNAPEKAGVSSVEEQDREIEMKSTEAIDEKETDRNSANAGNKKKKNKKKK
jgi:hypothetical protein